MDASLRNQVATLVAKIRSSPHSPSTRIIEKHASVLDALRNDECMTWDGIAELFLSFGLEIPVQNWRKIYSRLQTKRRMAARRAEFIDGSREMGGGNAPLKSEGIANTDAEAPAPASTIAPLYKRTASETVPAVEHQADHGSVMGRLLAMSAGRSSSDRTGDA